MNRQKGSFGETAAKDYLIKHGHKVIIQNYTSRFGEVDIISLKDSCIVFTEVKLRKNKSMVAGRESINFNKIRKIIKTALTYLSKQNTSENLNTRFDVIEVNCQEDYTTKNNIVHIKNAFTLNDVYLSAA